MSPISRGFRGHRPLVDGARVPPGQHIVDEFPVLSAGSTPHTPLDVWTFGISGAIDEPVSWTWEELRALAAETPTVDIHCVTAWSKLDTTWRGVSVDTLLAGLETEAEYVLAWCDGGYTTNLPLEDVTGGRAWIAYAFGGEPLKPEHGGAARLLIPHLYFWKSAKWVRGLQLLDDDEPGFWETYGYHNYGDPWKEQRYAGTEPLCVALHPGQPASGSSAVTGDRAQPVIGQANGLVALTVGCLALGTYIRRDLTGGAGIALSIGAVICVIGLNSASASGREQLATTPLSGLGPPLGLAVGPIIPRLRERGPRCAVRGAEATGAFDPAREPDGCARRTRDLRRTHGPHFRRCWRVVQRWIPRRH